MESASDSEFEEADIDIQLSKEQLTPSASSLARQIGCGQKEYDINPKTTCNEAKLNIGVF